MVTAVDIYTRPTQGSDKLTLGRRERLGVYIVYVRDLYKNGAFLMMVSSLL